MEKVSTFKYLGLLFTTTLSWKLHIHATIKKARKVLGLLFRNFYHHSSSSTLIRLYTTIVRPILEYASIVWDPSSSSVASSIESVQHFALRLASKSWSSPYHSLLSQLNLRYLSHRQTKSKIISLLKFKENLTFCPSHPPTLAPPSTYSLRSNKKGNLSLISCKSSSLHHSFFPSTIELGNFLPSSVKPSCSLSYIKLYVHCNL